MHAPKCTPGTLPCTRRPWSVAPRSAWLPGVHVREERLAASAIPLACRCDPGMFSRSRQRRPMSTHLQAQDIQLLVLQETRQGSILQINVLERGRLRRASGEDVIPPSQFTPTLPCKLKLESPATGCRAGRGMPSPELPRSRTGWTPTPPWHRAVGDHMLVPPDHRSRSPGNLIKTKQRSLTFLVFAMARTEWCGRAGRHGMACNVRVVIQVFHALRHRLARSPAQIPRHTG